MRSLVDRARLPSHPFARQSSPAPSSIRRGPDRRATRGAFGAPCGSPRRPAERCVLTSFCKPTCHHEHSRISLDFLRSPAGSRRRARPGERPARGRNLMLGPSRRRSEEALDGAPSASVSPGSQPSPERGSRAARYRAPRREVRVGAPPGRRFRPSERRGGAASDALCRSRPRWGSRLPSARDGPSSRTARPGARTVASAPLVKEGVAPRPSAPFHRSRGPLRSRLRGRFGRRSPASCNRNDSRARPLEPTGPFPVARGCPRASGTGGSALARRRRPANHSPGGR